MDEIKPESPQLSPENTALTPKEISLVDKNIQIINDPKTTYLSKKKAKFEIASFGNKALPYIKDKISEYNFSDYVDCFAEEKDLEMVLECLRKSLKNFDGSPGSHFKSALQRLIYQIRKNDPNSPVLNSIFEKLKEYEQGEIANEYLKYGLYFPIAMTGTEGAKNFIETVAPSDDKYQKVIANIDDINPDSIKPDSLSKLGLGLDEFSKDKTPKPTSLKNKIVIDEIIDNKTSVPATSSPEPPPPEEPLKKTKHILRVGSEKKSGEQSSPTRPVNSEAESNPLGTETIYPEKFVQFFEEMEKLHDLNPDVEQLINALEIRLGIENKLQRNIEAALLIDWPLYCTGVIANYPSLERMFGDKEWADWVTARLAARAYGNNSLSIDFITLIHSCLIRNTDPSIGDNIRDYGMRGGDYKYRGNPVTYTDEQLAALKDNPFLDFSQKGEDPNTGFIIYPKYYSTKAIESLSPKAREYLNQKPSDERLVECLLQDLCDWYNGQLKSEHDPYILAAELQRRFISIHPFGDVNGRTSRLLMNWSLENDGVMPAVLFDPNEDILTSKEKWANEVRYGSELYDDLQERRGRLEAIGYTSTAEMMGLSEAKTFYDLIFSKIKTAPALPQKGETLDHQAYAEFIGELQKEYEQFMTDYQNIRATSSGNGTEFFYQGGLIPESYVDMTTLVPNDFEAYQRYLRNRFFGKGLVYRGGVAIEEINSEEDVLKLFENAVGVGTGYLASQEAYVSPVSLRPIQPQFIAGSFRAYNSYLVNAYLSLEHPEITENEAKDINLAHMLVAHSNGDKEHMFDSPFVSTSLNVYTANVWSSNIDIKGGKTGIVFTSLAPDFGGIFTFRPGPSNHSRLASSDLPGLAGTTFEYSSEEELLVPGGLCPTAIQEVLIKTLSRTAFVNSYRAVKIEAPMGTFIKIEDLTMNKTSLYELDPATGHYRKSTGQQSEPPK